jgi:hypothetical protein
MLLETSIFFFQLLLNFKVFCRIQFSVGLEITYDLGNDKKITVRHGNTFAGERYCFSVGEDERIVVIEALSGWCIDSLTFRTSADETYIYGGSFGVAPVKQDFSERPLAQLAAVKGRIYVDDEATGATTIRHLQFGWLNAQ